MRFAIFPGLLSFLFTVDRFIARRFLKFIKQGSRIGSWYRSFHLLSRVEGRWDTGSTRFIQYVNNIFSTRNIQIDDRMDFFIDDLFYN